MSKAINRGRLNLSHYKHSIIRIGFGFRDSDFQFFFYNPLTKRAYQVRTSFAGGLM